MHLVSDPNSDYEPEFKSEFNMKFEVNNPHLGIVEYKEV